MQTLKFVLCLRSLTSNKVCCLVTANADFKQTRIACRYLQRRCENIPFDTESGSQKLRYRKFQGTVDIVATTILHLKNTQVQVDVQKNFQTKFVALLLQMPTSNRHELPADTCNDVVKIFLLIRKEAHKNCVTESFRARLILLQQPDFT